MKTTTKRYRAARPMAAFTLIALFVFGIPASASADDEAASGETARQPSPIKSWEFGTGRLSWPRDTLVNRVFGDNLAIESDPDSYIMGLRGESIVTYKSQLDGSLVYLGFTTQGGWRWGAVFGTAHSRGLWQDVDRHDPSYDASHQRVYAYPGTLKEWSNYYARISGEYDNQKVMVEKSLFNNSLLDFGILCQVERGHYRYSVQPPYYSFIQYSVLTDAWVGGLGLNTIMENWEGGMEFRGGIQASDSVRLFVLGGYAAGYYQLERDWRNRNIVSKTDPRGGTATYGGGAEISIMNKQHTIGIVYRIQSTHAIIKSDDHFLWTRYGSKGEALDWKKTTIETQYTFSIRP